MSINYADKTEGQYNSRSSKHNVSISTKAITFKKEFLASIVVKIFLFLLQLIQSWELIYVCHLCDVLFFIETRLHLVTK